MDTLTCLHYHRRALKLTTLILIENPEISATELAEILAWELGRDEWLNDENHWLWDLAILATTKD
jgi:hypothetical protein